MIRLTSILFFTLPMLVAADDQLPQPEYHRQPSDPAWLASVVQFHGHLGPAVVAGARMGMIGLRAVEAKGYFDVEVTCEGPLAKPPQACFLDGVQVGQSGGVTAARVRRHHAARHAPVVHAGPGRRNPGLCGQRVGSGRSVPDSLRRGAVEIAGRRGGPVPDLLRRRRAVVRVGFPESPGLRRACGNARPEAGGTIQMALRANGAQSRRTAPWDGQFNGLKRPADRHRVSLVFRG